MISWLNEKVWFCFLLTKRWKHPIIWVVYSLTCLAVIMPALLGFIFTTMGAAFKNMVDRNLRTSGRFIEWFYKD